VNDGPDVLAASDRGLEQFWAGAIQELELVDEPRVRQQIEQNRVEGEGR
jgi:hypothetical protein